LAYRECTFFVGAINNNLFEQLPIPTTTIPEPVCDDITFKPYTLYTSSGKANTVMSCRNESDALSEGYTYYANPASPPNSSNST
jgi:hypothetical protein